MSIIALLAAQSASEPPAPTPDPRPAPLDSTVELMRPTGRVIWTGTVAADGTGDYTSIQEAVSAAASAQAARMHAEGIINPTPNYATRIIVKAGEYIAHNIQLPRWCQMYGEGSDTTSIRAPEDGAGGGILNIGGSQYVEGVRLIKNVTAIKYPIHMVNAHTTIFADVHFDVQQVGGTGGGTAYGSDGADHGYTVLYKCKLTGGTNAHGWAETHQGQRIAYIHTIGTANANWAALNDVAPDECWVVGGSYQSVGVSGASTILHLDPETVVGSVTAGGSQDSRTDWPVPIGGLSEWDRALFGM